MSYRFHDIKIAPEYFIAIINGDKLFEVRKNDRNYCVGDLALLSEWKEAKYTGRYAIVEITYILKNALRYGLLEGFCIFSFRVLFMNSKCTLPGH